MRAQRRRKRRTVVVVELEGTASGPPSRSQRRLLRCSPLHLLYTSQSLFESRSASTCSLHCQLHPPQAGLSSCILSLSIARHSRPVNILIPFEAYPPSPQLLTVPYTASLSPASTLLCLPLRPFSRCRSCISTLPTARFLHPTRRSWRFNYRTFKPSHHRC